jgi:hypothetical protein
LGADVFYAAMTSMEFACPGIPTVSLVADLLHRDYPESLTKEQIDLRESRFDEIVRLSNRIQCLSKFTIDRLRSHYDLQHSRVFYTHAALPVGRTEEAPACAVANLPESPFFLYPANSWLHKNHEVLLAGYEIYNRRTTASRWPLVLTGHRDERIDSILKHADRLGIQGRVIHLGYLPKAALEHVWSRAGALVFPSRYEGFGMPILEAMKCGKPIISSRDGSLPEVACNAAYYFSGDSPEELAAALITISTDPLLRDKLSSSGQLRSESFNIYEEGSKLAAAFQSAAGEPAMSFSRIVTSDGSFGYKIIVGLPSRSGAETAEVLLMPPKSPVRLLLSQDMQPLGGFLLKPGDPAPIRIVVGPHARSLILEVISTKISEDLDCVWLEQIAMVSDERAVGRRIIYSRS